MFMMKSATVICCSMLMLLLVNDVRALNRWFSRKPDLNKNHLTVHADSPSAQQAPSVSDLTNAINSVASFLSNENPALLVGLLGESGHVQDLDGHSIDKFLNDHDYSLVLFYSPSCPHCVRFMPTFETVASAVSAEKSGPVNAVQVARGEK
jgi:hypothetical protein